MYDGTSHTVIAMTTLIGGFTLLVISQITGQPIQPGILTLVTMLMSGVSGWYFGTRSALAGAQAATTAAAVPTVATAPVAPAAEPRE